MSVSVNKIRVRWSTAARIAGLVTVAVCVVACESGKPRSTEFFMEDGLARDGVLARCNQDHQASVSDEECANARRAAAKVAEADEAGSAKLEKESERKLSALRDRQVRQEQADHDEAAAAKAAADAAYDAQWHAKGAQAAVAGSDPISDADDGFAQPQSLSQLPTRPALRLAAVTPPPSDINPPKPEIEHSAITPRPFRPTDSSTLK